MSREHPWIIDIVQAYNNLGGQAHYSELYKEVKKIRLEKGASWPSKAEPAIRRYVEDHSKQSKNFKGKDIFYSVQGFGKGTWALNSAYFSKSESPIAGPLYSEGIEGIIQEANYLRRSRDPKLIETRKLIDDFTCQCCHFRLRVSERYIIDVHHLNPIGLNSTMVTTTIEDLICLCPNCHRIAHTGMREPRSIGEIQKILNA